MLNLRLTKEIDDATFAAKGTELRDRIAVLKERVDGLDVTRGDRALVRLGDHA